MDKFIYIKKCASDVSHILRCTHSIVNFNDCGSRKAVSAKCGECMDIDQHAFVFCICL